MEIKIMCPYCEGENYVEEGYESVFCANCGKKIEIKYTGGYRVVEPWMRTLEDAGLCMEMKEYEKAERMIAQLIKEQPGNFWLYRPYVEAITEDYSKLNLSNYDRVMAMVDKMISLAPEEEKAEAQDWKNRVQESYDVHVKYHESCKWAEMAADEKSNIIACVIYVSVGLLLFAASLFLYKDPAVIEITRPMFGAGVVICLGMLFVHIFKYKKALRRFEKLNAEVQVWIQKMNSRVS